MITNGYRFAVALVAAAGAGCASSRVLSQARGIDAGSASAPVSTTDLDSGKIKVGDISNPSLENLLADLNRRKDFDYLCHCGQPGPDAAYLWVWVQRVMGELASRGYFVDQAGQMYRPGGVAVAMR